MKRKYTAKYGATAALLGLATALQAATWTGAGGNLNWSTPGNWDTPPTTTENVTFGNSSGFTNAAGAVNNIVDTTITVATLSYSSVPNNFHTTLIPAGQTLFATGTRSVALGTSYTSTDTLFVGSGVGSSGATAQIYESIKGGGSLVVSNTSGNIDVTQTTTATTGVTTKSTLDLSGLDTLRAYVNQVRVGYGAGDNASGGNRPSGTLILAKTNVINCSSTTWGLGVGETGSNNGAPSTNLLGQANWINANYGIGIGRKKCTGTLAFQPGLVNPFVVFRNLAGTGGMAYWVIGDNYDSGNTGVSLSALADFSAGSVDALVTNIIYVGRSYNSSGGTSGSTATGKLIFGQGIIGVNNLEIGYQQSSSAGIAVGELALQGPGSLVVTNNIRLGRVAGGAGTGTGTLTVSGGTVRVSGRIYDGGGTSTVNITGGLVDLQPEGDATGGDIAVDTLTVSDATITNAATISAASLTLGTGGKVVGNTTFSLESGATLDASGAAGLTLGPTQTLQGQGTVIGDVTVVGGARLIPATDGVVGTLALNNALTLSGGAVLPFDLSDQPAYGNDQINVSGNLTLSGINTIPLKPVNAALGLGNYTLIGYSGSLSGGAANLQISGPILQSRSTLQIDTTTPNQVNLVVSGSAAKALTWVGDTTANVWDTKGAANWTDGAVNEKFYAFDPVVFTDSGSVSPAVNLQGTLYTPSISLSNSTAAYTFGGTGAVVTAALNLAGGGSLKLANDGQNSISSITGPGTLIKAGTNVLALAGTNSAFTGAVRIEGGTLRTLSGAVLGDTTGGTTVTNGGTLDLAGQNLGGEPIYASGAGVGSAGAIDNSGVEQQNALQNVALEGNTTFGASTQRWDIITGGTGLKGNGFTLRKVGPKDIWVKSASDTDLGDIEIAQGVLGFQTVGTTMGRAANTVTIRSNATLGFWAVPVVGNKNIVMDDGATLYAGGGDCEFGGTISLNGTNSFWPDAVTNYCDALIGGSGILVKGGSGVLHLGAANTFASDIIVNTGSLWVTNPAGLGPAKKIVLTGTSSSGTAAPNPGSGLRLEGDATLPASYTLAMNSAASNNIRSVLFTALGTNTVAGPISLSGDGLCQVAVNSATAQLNLNGDVTGTPGFAGTFFVRGNSGVGVINGKLNLGAGNLSKTDNNTWVVNSTGNTWNLATVAVGTARIGADNALCPTAAVQMGQPSGGTSTLDLAGFNQEVAGLQNAGASTQTIGNSSTNNSSTLTINANTNTYTYDKIIADVVGGGTMKVNVNIASGKQNFTATNTYTGTTTIAGTLGLVGGAKLNSSVLILAGGTLDASTRTDGILTLGAGQTLSGSGTVLGAAILSPGSTLSPGTSLGTLNFSATVVLQGATLMEIQKAGTTLASDLVQSANGINYGGSLTVSATGDALAEGNSFKLFGALAYTGAGFTNLTLPSLPGSLTWSNRLALDGTILVAKASSPVTPTNITFQVSGSNLTIGWPSSYLGWILQVQNNPITTGLSNNWTTVPGSETNTSMTFPLNPALPTVFYRLFYQGQ